MPSQRKRIQLTAALEDYLEAIYHLSRFDKAAHSRDIAEALNVHKSTVTAALKVLGQMELINYSPYEAVTLTSAGEKIAIDVVKRHNALKDFFINVLLVDQDMAESAACGMEHSMPCEIVEKLVAFASFVKSHQSRAGDWLERFRPNIAKKLSIRKKLEHGTQLKQLQTNAGRNRTRSEEMAETLTLDQVSPGGKAQVVSLAGDGVVKKRIAEMGITKGSVLEVERVAPLGDPLDIKVKGYRLSLRKEEAARVVVKSV